MAIVTDEPWIDSSDEGENVRIAFSDDEADMEKDEGN